MASSWTLDDFRGEFDEVEFVEKLTQRMGSTASATGAKFDPAPYQASFSRAVAAIDDLERNVTASIAKATKELAVADRAHQRKLKEHGATLDAVLERFARLDRRISSVAQTAVRIGDQLEVIDVAKQRNAYGSKMIGHFLSMTGERAAVPDAFKGQTLDDLREAASTVQALQQAAQDLSRLPNMDHAIKNISNAADEIENRLLKEFDQAWQANHVPGMRACAASLLEFEGGHLIARIIARIIGEVGPNPDPPDSVEQFHSELSRLMDSISNACSKYFPLIAEVFPQPEKVIKPFVERVYEDNITGLLETGVGALSADTNAYLAALEIGFDLNRKLMRSLTAQVEELKLPSDAVLTSFKLALKDHADGLFFQYRDTFISRQFDVLVRDSRSRIDRTLAILPQATDDNPLRSEYAVSITDWIRAVFQTHIVDALLDSFSIALARVDKLAEPSRLPEYVWRIYKTLVEIVNKPFLHRLADSILESMSDEDGGDMVAVENGCTLEFVGCIDAIVQRLNDFFDVEIAKRLQDSLNLLTNCAQERHELTVALESKMSRALRITLDLAMQCSARTLSNLQQKTDFRPKDDQLLPDGSGCSPAASAVVDYIGRHSGSAIAHLRGKNLDCYLHVLGLRLYDLLSNHIRQFVVSNAGALLLMADIRVYQDLVRQFHVSEVNDRFETLRHVVNVFAVPAESLGSLMNDDPVLAVERIPRDDLHSFIKMRSDYKQNNLRKYFA
ncbi:Exocyst complex component Sec10 [Plasmodiophora brassicae]|uniref:Uncharacterized protein n=1 Tax=Plasmodiophora brassicae TaxID=37360 RepID=A0A0G4ITG9_PLABS|nr:hypothetical protein PBRA_006679 [Plasmodiophora brassicae]SPQ95808.1 unnamed protein product [Plasmodiophora brassicae]